MSQIALEHTPAPWLMFPPLATAAAMDIASYRDSLEVLDASSCMTPSSAPAAAAAARQQHHHQLQQQKQHMYLAQDITLKYGPCTFCADKRHQPEQLSLLCDTLEDHGFAVQLQPYAVPNRLEVWVAGEQVFVLCDLRRISKGDRNATLTCQTILSILQQ